MFFYYHFRSCLINITLLLYSTVPAYCGPEEYERVLKLISLLVIYISFSPSHIISIELLYFFSKNIIIIPIDIPIWYTNVYYYYLSRAVRIENHRGSCDIASRRITILCLLRDCFFFFHIIISFLYIKYYLCGRLMNGRRLKVDTGTCLLFACISYMLARIQYYNIMCIFL